jgi:ankyrin repeat protein
MLRRRGEHELHARVARGDLDALRAFATGAPARFEADLNAPDGEGRTPLMLAAESSEATVEMLRWLIGRGADVGAWSEGEAGQPVLAYALRAADVSKARALVEAGADVRYRSPAGYDAAIHAASSSAGGPRLLDVLRFVVEQGAPLSTVSAYGEAALRMLSHVVRFDAVRLLLEAGADERLLGWTPLLRATALGSLEEVAAWVRGGAPLEACDSWSRTAWLLAVCMGDLDKARLLLDAGSDPTVRSRVGRSALHHAAEGGRPEVIRWLLGIGLEVDARSDFDQTALHVAAEKGFLDVVDALVVGGAEWRRRARSARFSARRVTHASSDDSSSPGRIRRT